MSINIMDFDMASVSLKLKVIIMTIYSLLKNPIFIALQHWIFIYLFEHTVPFQIRMESIVYSLIWLLFVCNFKLIMGNESIFAGLASSIIIPFVVNIVIKHCVWSVNGCAYRQTEAAIDNQLMYMHLI